LARTPQIDPSERMDYLATAQTLGYELDELIDTPQRGAPA